VCIMYAATVCMSGERGELEVISFCFLLVSFFKPCIASHCCIAFGDGGDLHVRLWNCAVLHALSCIWSSSSSCLSRRQKQKPGWHLVGTKGGCN